MALMQGAVAQYSGCPEQYGVQTYPHDQYCDKFYLCVNGKNTFSHNFFLRVLSFIFQTKGLQKRSILTEEKSLCIKASTFR